MVQNPDCFLSYDTPHWKIGIRKIRIKSINIQIICIFYNLVNEFIQPEGNNVFAPTPFYQFKVENITNMEHSRFNKNNFIKHIWYVINQLYDICFFVHNFHVFNSN